MLSGHLYGDRQANTGRSNTDLNACEICASADVRNYRKMQNPIHIDTYI